MGRGVKCLAITLQLGFHLMADIATAHQSAKGILLSLLLERVASSSAPDLPQRDRILRDRRPIMAVASSRSIRLLKAPRLSMGV